MATFESCIASSRVVFVLYLEVPGAWASLCMLYICVCMYVYVCVCVCEDMT